MPTAGTLVTPNRDELAALTGLPATYETTGRGGRVHLHAHGVELVWVRLGRSAARC